MDISPLLMRKHVHCVLFLFWPECTLDEEIEVVTKENTRPMVANEDNVSFKVVGSCNLLFEYEIARFLCAIVVFC